MTLTLYESESKTCSKQKLVQLCKSWKFDWFMSVLPGSGSRFFGVITTSLLSFFATFSLSRRMRLPYIIAVGHLMWFARYHRCQPLCGDRQRWWIWSSILLLYKIIWLKIRIDLLSLFDIRKLHFGLVFWCRAFTNVCILKSSQWIICVIRAWIFNIRFLFYSQQWRRILIIGRTQYYTLQKRFFYLNFWLFVWI